MKHLSFLFLLLGNPSLFAQQSGIDQSMDLVTLPTGEKVICWFGHTGRSYFVQVSHPNNHLSEWTWAPVMESGNDEEISHEVDGTADKGFFRLKYTDQVPGPGETLESSDFDGDGISNINEIDPPSPLLATDPLNGDTDGDGLNDGWERSFAAEMLALGAPPEHWGANFPSLQSGDFDPLAILQDDGMTIQELYNASSANDYRMLLHDLFIQAKRAEFGFYVTHDSTSYDDGRPTVNDGGGNIIDGSPGFGSGTIETWSRTPPSSLQLDVQLDPFAVSPNTSLAWYNNESQYAAWTYHTHWDLANDPNPGNLFPIEEMGQSSVSFLLTDGGSNAYYQFQETGPLVDGESTTKIRWSGGTKKSKFRLYRPRPTKDPLEQYFLKVTTEHPIVMIDNDPGNVGWSTSPPTKTVGMITATIPAYGHTSPWIETTPVADAQKSREVELLPVEVRVRQNQGYTGPHGSESLYQESRPQSGFIKGEVFSLWDNENPAGANEEAYVTIGGWLGEMIDNGNLPANSVKWEAPDHTTIFDQSEFRVEWGTTGQKEVKLTVFGESVLIHFTVPDVGSFGRDSPILLLDLSLPELLEIENKGEQVRDAVNAKYGTTGGTGGARQDAIRHSTWTAVVANTFGIQKTLLASTANEYTGKVDALPPAISSNTVMDINNNSAGAIQGHLQFGQNLTTQQLMDQMEALYDAGNALIKWMPDTNTVYDHHGMLRWSTGEKLFNE